MNRVLIAGAIAAALILGAPHIGGAQQLPELSLEELMSIDAGHVFGAAERIQPVIEAPASVSFITAEEIAKYGYRTLADILRGVRGIYVSDDRSFSLIGTRGFAKPGDYNSRILLLVNGHRVNDNVFGQAEIGAEFGIDPAMFERVEIIRGPASSIYGDSAFFAVVNVITRSGASLGGDSLMLEGGTLGTARARASSGHRLANGVDFALSGTFEQSAGMKRIYFPAFDSPATNGGVAEGLDGERLAQFYGKMTVKNVIVTAVYARRQRDIPTASFGTRFNEQQSLEQATDRHTLADVEYGRSFGRSRLVARASFDQFSYDGRYPYVAVEDGGATVVGLNSVLGTRWSAGGRFTRPLPGSQMLTLGAEFIHNVRQDQKFGYIDAAGPVLDAHASSVQHALYVQDEVRPVRWLIMNGGLRYDQYQDFRRVTPRAALIAMPSSSQSFKYLYGRAFRAPNAYELNGFYFGERTRDLRPESIDTHEIVWERYMNDWLRTSVSTYWYQAEGLITLADDPSAFLGTTFVNEGRVRARGLELETQMRLRRQIQGLMSYALQSAKDVDTGAPLFNSPRHMAKLRLSAPWPLAVSSLSMEVLYLGSRLTLAHDTLQPAITANLTMLWPVSRTLELVGSVRNVFNEQYADPGSEANLQDSIPQNGRTIRIGLSWRVGPR